MIDLIVFLEALRARARVVGGIAHAAWHDSIAIGRLIIHTLMFGLGGSFGGGVAYAIINSVFLRGILGINVESNSALLSFVSIGAVLGIYLGVWSESLKAPEVMVLRYFRADRSEEQSRSTGRKPRTTQQGKFDRRPHYREARSRSNRPSSEHTERTELGLSDAQTVYIVGVVALAAKLAKADGTVTTDEVNALHKSLPSEICSRKEVAQIYDEAKRSATHFEGYALQLEEMFRLCPKVLESIYAILFSVAIADGSLHQAEERFLGQVANIFGLPPWVVDSVEAAFRADTTARRYSEQEDLAILGLREPASDEDVRKVYRKLAKELHPDVLVAQGMPKEFVENAERRLAEVNAAYDRIQKRRSH